jgi:hypothetical protein
MPNERQWNESELVAAAIEHARTLTDEGRLEFLGRISEGFCRLCGSPNLPCYCDPAYDE